MGKQENNAVARKTMTDEQIEYALEYCPMNSSCRDCPYNTAGDTSGDCFYALDADALAYIQRLKAELVAQYKFSKYLFKKLFVTDDCCSECANCPPTECCKNAERAIPDFDFCISGLRKFAEKQGL